MSRVTVLLNQSAARYRLKLCAAWRRIAHFPNLPEQITKNIIVFFLLPFVLSACAIEGDFGRPQATIFDRVADEFLSSGTTLLGSRGGSGVTDDELAMRESGHRLASPLIPSIQGVPGPYGSSTSAGSSLEATGAELQSDHQALTRFGSASRRVLVTDARRMQAVYEHDPNILVEDKRSARERMKENFSFIELTFEDLDKRLQAYFYIIDEARANAPDVFTSELEASLNHLRDRTASLKYELTHYFGAAVARGEYRAPRFASRERSYQGPRVPYRRSVQPEPYAFK